MPFRIALSGLNAASADLSVTANNIANANTVGFKESRAEFSEVFAAGTSSLSTSISGSGVQLTNVSQSFSQGNIDFTNNTLDLAIAGEGFFRLSDDGAPIYSRAGNFSVNRDGFLVNPQGAVLQGYPIDENDNVNSGILNDLRVIVGTSAPGETTDAEVGVNLPADSPVPANAPFNSVDPSTYNHTTSTTIYDSLGAPHTQSYYFVKQPADNTWELYNLIDNNLVGPPTAVQFGQDGTLAVPAGGLISLPPYDPMNGSAPISVTVDLSQTTQFGDTFAVNNLNQDGFTTGRLSGVDVSNTGIIFARFTNGQAQSLGAVAMARFTNPNGLDQRNDTAWSESFESGGVILGEAGTASFGLIQSGALEASNTELTEQLVNMITAQRNFQSNAQMITTADEITQTVLNIR